VASSGSAGTRRSVLKHPAVRTPLLAPAKGHPFSAGMPLGTLPRLWVRDWQKFFCARHLRGAAHPAWYSDVGKRKPGTPRSTAQPQRAPGLAQDSIGSGTTVCSCKIGDSPRFRSSQRGRRLRVLLPIHFRSVLTTGLVAVLDGYTCVALVHPPRRWRIATALWGSTPKPLAHAALSLCGGPLAHRRRPIGMARLGVAHQRPGRTGQIVGMMRTGGEGEGT
jgi:hypothetical protein